MRIAVVGLLLESNAFAPLTRQIDLDRYLMLEGHDVVSFCDQLGFSQIIKAEHDLELVPILIAGAESGGPIVHEDYSRLVSRVERDLCASLPLDGVFIYGHGAGKSTEIEDLDGDFFSRIRGAVGDSVPIVAELDLHANLSALMVNSVDILVGYQTNPHIDQAARAQEAARHLLKLIEGHKSFAAFQTIPLLTPQVCQLTSSDQPLGKLFDLASDLVEAEDLANITLLPGFAFADTEDAAFSVCVTSWRSAEHAKEICDVVAERVWSLRADFKRRTYTIAEAVEREGAYMAQSEAPRIYADIADNPGGGGRGNTTDLVRKFDDARLDQVIAGAFFDPHLVQCAQEAGEGSRFVAKFNCDEESPFSARWDVAVVVEKLLYGQFTSEIGTAKGQHIDLGACCVLLTEQGQTKILVCSDRKSVV